MRARSLLFLALLLAGCGGHGDGGSCAGVLTPVANAAYAGTYDAVYTPGGGLVGGSLEFTVVVAADGTVSGSVLNPSVAPGI